LPSTNGISLFDACYNLSSRGNVEVPTVSFHFPDGKLLPLQAKNYMVPLDSEGTFCFAFAPTASSLSIIGNVQQRGTVSVMISWTFCSVPSQAEPCN
jgi:hypothetical protein